MCITVSVALIFAVCGIFLLYLIAFATHQRLFRDAVYLSPETKRLQKSLTILLVAQVNTIRFAFLIRTFQTTLPILIIGLPTITMVAFLFYQYEGATVDYKFVNDYGFRTLVMLICLYAFLNALQTLLIIKPYRQFIIDSFLKFVKLNTNRNVRVIPSVSINH